MEMAAREARAKGGRAAAQAAQATRHQSTGWDHHCQGAGPGTTRRARDKDYTVPRDASYGI